MLPRAIDRARYYDFVGVSRLLDMVSESTLRRWIRNGWTSFGLSLDVIERGGHLLVPELNVRVAREFLLENPLPKPGVRPSERRAFRKAAAMFSMVEPRSPYSRKQARRCTALIP